jgi:anti-anti-sigma factor
MTDTNITIEEAENGIKIAHVSGQLDESNVDEKIQVLYKLVEQNPKGLNLLLNLENLEYMNSKCIGYFTDLYGKISESGGKVVIAKAKPNIIDILQVVGLTQLINNYESVEEASSALTSAAQTALEAAPAPEAAAETPAATPETPPAAPAPEAPATTPAETPATPPEAPEPAPTSEPAEAVPAAPETLEPTPEAAPEAPTPKAPQSTPPASPATPPATPPVEPSPPPPTPTNE